jgi:hypothetical protein
VVVPPHQAEAGILLEPNLSEARSGKVGGGEGTILDLLYVTLFAVVAVNVMAVVIAIANATNGREYDN